MKIYCCGCEQDIEARLTDGFEIYPHRKDLGALPFWICDTCKNYVGCHHKTDEPTKPLGVIATPELKNARQHIHKLIDPIWQSGRMSRKKLYKALSEKLGWRYHTADLRSMDQARQAYLAAKLIAINPHTP